MLGSYILVGGGMSGGRKGSESHINIRVVSIVNWNANPREVWACSLVRTKRDNFWFPFCGAHVWPAVCVCVYVCGRGGGSSRRVNFSIELNAVNPMACKGESCWCCFSPKLACACDLPVLMERESELAFLLKYRKPNRVFWKLLFYLLGVFVYAPNTISNNFE